MADNHLSTAELDALIEAALRDQPLVPVPRNLHARITERIALAALEQKERTRFRNTLLGGLAASVGVLAVAVVLVALTNFDVLLDYGVSGGQGLMDYYTATFQLSWPGRLDSLFLSLCLFLAALTVGVGVQPLRRWNLLHAGHGVQDRHVVRGGSRQGA